MGHKSSPGRGIRQDALVVTALRASHLSMGLKELEPPHAAWQRKRHTRVGSAARSAVTPICSLHPYECDRPRSVACGEKTGHNAPRDSKQVIPVHTLVLPNLVVRADATSIDHNTPLRVCLRVEEVVALGAEVEGGLVNVGCECVCRSMSHEDTKEVRCISE